VRVKTALCFVVLMQAVACAGDLDDPERFAGLLDAAAGDSGTGSDAAATGNGGGGVNATVPECVTTLLTDRCGSQFCHGPGEAQVDLVSDGLEGRLVDAPANEAGPCTGTSFIATGGDSLLLQKVGDPDTCGAPMPISGGALSVDEVGCLEAWVVGLGGMAGAQ